MKRSLALTLVSSLLVFTAARPALAAAPKAEARSAAIVAALQAVSPDALGGQLGLTVATVRANERAPSRRAAAIQTANDTDRRAYAAWKKNSGKS